MPSSMLYRLSSLGLAAVIACGLAATPALAADKPQTKRAPKASRKPVVAVEAPVPDAQPDQVKAAELVYYGVYDCEFKQTVNISQSAKHSAYVDVKAGKHDWLMKPVLSSTGAIRLEDVRGETLMVQISSKSMLLNVKSAQRIVDDCISPKQRELMAQAVAAKAAAEAAAVKAVAQSATSVAPAGSAVAAQASPDAAGAASDASATPSTAAATPTGAATAAAATK